MTIAIGLKVGDGIVLGADSAWTLADSDGNPTNVFFNAEKITNLVKGLPVGMVAFGLGAFEGRSITRHAKDLRGRLCGSDPEHLEWTVNPYMYTVQGIAGRVREFFFEELYARNYPPESATHADFGFMVGGYSAGSRSGEIWRVAVHGGECPLPQPIVLADDPVGLKFDGQPEALNRLVRGWSSEVIEELAVVTEEPPATVISSLDRIAPLFNMYMPIQDAVDLVRYLIEVTAGFVKFSPGWPTVALPADLAAVTWHEGFRWVERKHYYEPALNVPPTEADLVYRQPARGSNATATAGRISAQEPDAATEA